MTDTNTSQQADTSQAQAQGNTPAQKNAPAPHSNGNGAMGGNGVPTKPKVSGLGITALVLGIIAVIGSWIPILNNVSAFVGFVGAVLGIVGIVLIAKSKGAKGGKGIAIAGTILSVLAIIITLSTQSLYSTAIDKAADSAKETTNKATGNSTEELLKNDVSVDFGEYSIESSTYSKTGYLNVVITNKASEAKSYSIQIEAVDKSGTRIDSGYAVVNKLQAGQSETQKLFNAFTDDKVAQFQEATFKIVSVSQY